MAADPFGLLTRNIFPFLSKDHFENTAKLAGSGDHQTHDALTAVLRRNMLLVHWKRLALVQLGNDFSKEGNHLWIIRNENIETTLQNTSVHGCPYEKEFRQDVTTLVPLRYSCGDQVVPLFKVEPTGLGMTRRKAVFQELRTVVEGCGTGRLEKDAAIEKGLHAELILRIGISLVQDPDKIIAQSFVFDGGLNHGFHDCVWRVRDAMVGRVALNNSTIEVLFVPVLHVLAEFVNLIAKAFDKQDGTDIIGLIVVQIGAGLGVFLGSILETNS